MFLASNTVLVLLAVAYSSVNGQSLTEIGAKCSYKMNEVSYDYMLLKDQSDMNRHSALRRSLKNNNCFVQNNLEELHSQIESFRLFQKKLEMIIKSQKNHSDKNLEQEYRELEISIDKKIEEIRTSNKNCIQAIKSLCRA